METADGCKMPPSTYVSVRLSDTLKQGKYDPNRSYKFDNFKDRRRQAKIDIFRLVGSSGVMVSADEVQRISEVMVSSNDPIINDLRLKVTAKQANANKAGTKPIAPLKKDKVRRQAEQYLEKHRVQEKVSSAMQHLLQKQPEDPIDFLCSYLQSLKEPKPVPQSMPEATPAPKVTPAYVRAPALAAANTYYRRLRSELAPDNAGAYYSQHVLPAVLPPALSTKMYSRFPDPRKGVQSIADTNTYATAGTDAGGDACAMAAANVYNRMLEIRLAAVEAQFAAKVDFHVQQRFANLACLSTLPQEDRPFVSAMSEDALNILLQAEAMLMGRNARDFSSEVISLAKNEAKATFLKSLGLDTKDKEVMSRLLELKQLLEDSCDTGALPQALAQIKASSRGLLLELKQLLEDSCDSGVLAQALAEIKAGEKWSLKPSVGTWLANPAPQKKSEPGNTWNRQPGEPVIARVKPSESLWSVSPSLEEYPPKPCWNKRPSIGTWLHVR